VLVAQPKRRHHAGFLLEAGKPHPLAPALTRATVRPGSQRPPAINGGFLEHLLTHLAPPRQSGNHNPGFTRRVDGHHPARVLGLLPRVERVDQIKPRPRHLGVGVSFALGERGFHHRKAPVKREPGRSGMPGQHLLLLDGGIEAEFKRGVPAHLIGEHPMTDRQPPTSSLSCQAASAPSKVIWPQPTAPAAVSIRSLRHRLDAYHPVRRPGPSARRADVPAPTVAEIPRRDPVCTANWVRVAARAARVHRRPVGRAPAFPAPGEQPGHRPSRRARGI
jgi:hypothetical protein